MKTFQILFLSFFILFLASCTDKKQEINSDSSISLNFQHTIDHIPFAKDQFLYTNKAGNVYMISDIQWFISDIQFTMSDGTIVRPESDQTFIYIDSDLPETSRIEFNHLPAGQFQKISFTFGLDEVNNTSYRFVNPPESYMFWPEYLGGGYHYMKLNGKWIDMDNLEVPFNFHLGIGQLPVENRLSSDTYFHFGSVENYTHCEGFTPPLKLPDVLSFVQNYFTVSQDISFELMPELTTKLFLEMQLDQWFDSKTVYDHNEWGGSVMQQQDVQQIARENGKSVFIFHQ
jgi:hypothetical protein